MSIFIQGSTLYIQQLQGVPGIFIPPELQDSWHVRFIEACRTFARQQGYHAVLLPKADTLYSYRLPTVVDPTKLPQKLVQLRKSMELRYDITANHLGFAPSGDWFVWKNDRLL